MKTIGYILILSSLIILSCDSFFTNNGLNEKYKTVNEYLSNAKSSGFLGDSPIIVVEGIVFTIEHLKKRQIDFQERRIEKIMTFKKNDPSTKLIYGERANEGVILIKLKKTDDKSPELN